MRRAVRRGVGFALGLTKLVVVLVLLALTGLVVMGAITTQRGWSETSGTLVVEGLHQSVTVSRDRAGIIQITAADPHDLFLAQGYVHAQERMWQMEISRRVGAGRLSELFGAGQVDTDRYIRTLGWRQAAQRDLDAMSPEVVGMLQAYADGVNAWIAAHSGSLSTPFVVAGLLSGTGGLGGYELEPWTPLDTATWQKVQAWSLGGNLDAEIFRLLADARLGNPARTDELFPAYDPAAPVITPTGLIGSGGAGSPGPPGGGGEPAAASRAGEGSGAAATSPPIALDDDDAAALVAIAGHGAAVTALAGLDRGEGLVDGHGVGSNNWVVSGDRTASGKPILANDPHLGFGMPSVWIMNGLHCRTVSASCPWDVIGVSFPGAPAVILGHNAHIAWGATNVEPDTQDLFLETADQSDPDGHYIFQGASVAYDMRHEVIKVAGAADVEFDVRSTRHGVVLSDVDDRLDGGPVLALRWTTTAEVDLALETFFRINTASTFDDFRAAFDAYGSPSQNFVYADMDGHIGYVLPGLVPERAGPNGDRVRNGTSGAEEWTGYVPREALPWQLDPEGGQIVTANNAPVDEFFPHWLGSGWDPGDRAARIEQLLAEVRTPLTTADMRAIQADDYVLRADRVLPRLQALEPAVATEDGRMLLGRLAGWDRRCGVDSLGCAAYMTVEHALLRAIFDDELGPLARDYVGSPYAWQALTTLLSRPASAWWAAATGGVSAPQDAADVAGRAIDGVAADLREAFGDPAGWTWGALHQVSFRESTLGSSGIAPLEWYLNAPPRPVAGANGAINNNYYRTSRAYPDPDDPDVEPVGFAGLFWVTNGPSYRLTVDMDDLDGARIIITTGQSGNPFDPHYADLIPLWAAGETVPLPFSPPNVAASTFETLTLTPR